jgi:hypothetical protein
MKPFAQVAGGISAFNSGKYTRKIMFGNAQERQAQGVMERDKIRFASRIAEGRQLVAQGGSGFGVGTGSAVDELMASATARELDLLTSHYNADSQARGYRNEGNQAYAQGKSALYGGIISGATTLMEQVAGAFGGAAGGGGMSLAGQKSADGGL